MDFQSKLAVFGRSKTDVRTSSDCQCGGAGRNFMPDEFSKEISLPR
jgi:hypothetical protein